MDDSALKIALKRLLAHGNAAEDAKMVKLANSKKPMAAPDMCPKCNVAMVDGKCPKCGLEATAEDAMDGGDGEDMASLLEQGASEG